MSSVPLPGALDTMLSGIGIFYPDGSRTQVLGVKIDQKVYSTIRGIAEGREELMEKAIELINTRW